jgi:outer membrane protein assembly factor BamB/subtilase family serine protease
MRRMESSFGKAFLSKKRFMNKGIAVITIILLLFSASIPAIALNQTGEELNNTENFTIPLLLHTNETAQANATISNNGTESFKVELRENEDNESENATLMRITVVIKDSDENIHIQDLSLNATESLINATAIACEKGNITFNLSDGNITKIDGLNDPKLFLYNRESREWDEANINHTLKDMEIIGWSDKNDLPLMLPDITSEDITITSFGGIAYTNITNKVTVRISNDGLVNASNFTALFTVNNETVDEIRIESLNRMETKSILFNWIPNTTGNYSLTVELDPEDNISESNETNNNVTIDVTVKEVSVIRVPTDYPTIQEAIDNAPPGSMIYIEGGEYHLNDNCLIRIINKSDLWIKGSENVKFIVDNGRKPPVKIENSGWIRLSGFTLDTPPVWTRKYDYFIGISNSSRCEIVDSSIMSSSGANNIHAEPDSSEILVEGCRLRSIDLHAGSIICNNTVKDIYAGSNSTIYNNTASRIYAGSNNSTLYNNIASEIYLGGCDYYGCTYSNNNTPHNNHIMGDGQFTGLVMNGNNNTIYNNTINSLGSYYYPFEGENSKIYLNNIFGIGHAGVRGKNHWNSTTTMNYTYNGSEYTNYTGNFWFNYNAVDNNNDGIGDVSYKIGNDYDYYPLIEPHGLTFDLATTGVVRPHVIYANRTNTILASVERTGTYPVSERARVNLTANGNVVASEVITMGIGQRIVRFAWEPKDVGNYTLTVDIHPEGIIRIERNDTNNEFSIHVNVSQPLFNYSENITSALDFLNSKQLPRSGISGLSNSARAALGIIAAGEDPSSGRWKPPQEGSYSLIEYLREEPENSAGFLPPGSNPPCLMMEEDFARMILVISAIGEDPTNFGDVNYLVMLKSYYNGEQFGDPDSVEDDVIAILALLACEDKDPATDSMIVNATNYIIDRQNTDGGWSSYGEGSDVKTTSLVIQALIAAGEDKNSQVITKALNYLRDAQSENGSYSNVKETSYAIQAFIAAGEELSSYTETINYLLSLQQPDGSFNYTANISLFPPVTTTYPIPALCGEPYPVMVKTANKIYALPDISVSSDLVTEETLIVNTSYTVTTSIRSNGGIFYVDLLADDEFVARKKVHSVWHDSVTSVSFSWKPNTTGDHNLTVFADSMNNITESDEGNNNGTIKRNVTLPDLYPSGITPPDETYVNVPNIINCTIRGTTDEHFNVTLREADGDVVGTQRVKGIRDNATLSFDWRPAENRAYNLRLTVDSDSEVRERDEDNNTLSKYVDVLLPDLIPASITADEIFVNATNKINVTVNGMAENFTISLIDNGTVVGKTANVTCYGIENVTVYWKPTTLGDHTITAFVDSDGDIRESNEGNNNIAATFEVLLPDLVPEKITPEVLYIDEVNTITVKVNGTAEGFNATLVADKLVDKSGPLCFLLAPIVNGTFGESETFSGTDDDSYLTYNITGQRASWSWEDINMLAVIIASNTSSGQVDSGDTWCVDYVALVVNYTDASSTNCTVEPNASASEVIYSYNWSNESSTCSSDDEYATATGLGVLSLNITDTDVIPGNITSVVIKVEQHVVNAVTSKKETTLKETNLDTYNGSIEFEWVPMKLGIYNLTVSLDSDNNTAETNETNNNLTKRVIVAKRIDLELTSPTGGEVWEGVKNITWNASYEEPLLIDFYYSPDRGYRWINITTNETNDGSYAWNTEDVIDGEYMLKIVARAGVVTAEDRSDVFFIRNREAGMEWGSFHANAGYAPCDGPDTPEIAWVSDDIGAEGSSSLIVARNKIFVYCTGWGGMSSDYTYLVALRQWDDEDGNAGDVLWGTPIAPRVYGSWATPAYKDGSVFVSSGNGVYRIDAETGKIEWEFKFPTGKGSVNGGPAVTNRAVYVGDWDGGNYYCFDTVNGTEIYWVFDVTEGGASDGRSQAVPAIAYGNVYFGSFTYYRGQSRTYCVDAISGEEIWNTPTGAVCGLVTVADGLVYHSTYTGGKFFALNAFNGSVIWTNNTGWTDSTPAYYAPSKSPRSYIYVSTGYSGPGTTYCLDAKTGEIIWQFSGVGYWTNSPVVTRDGKVFAGKYGGGFIPGYSELYCLDAFTGEELWHSDCGGSSPVVVNGFVYTIGGSRVIALGNGTRPDLTVEADAPDSKYVVGKKGNITATIENIGKSNVTKSFEVELRYSGKFEECIDTKTVEASPESPFKVNDTKPILFKWTPEKPGENRLTVEVDPDNNVSESDLPDNNIANVTVLVKDNKPDLVTIIETVSPNSAYVGDTVTVEANITNIGYETNESFWVRFSVDDVEENMNLTSLEDNVRLLDFTWIAMDNGTHNLAVDANPGDRLTITNEVTWTNNNDSREVEVMPTPTPTPTPTSPPGIGPGSGGGRGGGDESGIGEGSGIGEAGAGEAGGIQIPANTSGSTAETKKKVFGFPFGNATSGASGGGGTLPLLFIALITLTVALFYFGYYKEKRTHTKHFGLYRKGRR